jgi:hypothetical protein
LEINGIDEDTVSVPALAVGESHVGAFAAQDCPPSETITITVCADNFNEVEESDESNNCLVNVWLCDPPGEYWAVIVGVSDYADLKDLPYSKNDANDIYNRLRSYDNWKESNMERLIDSAATKANIHNAIDRMKTNADDNDICLFYFSGHGGWSVDVPPIDEYDGFDEYICPHDSTLTVEGTLTVEDSIRDDELDEWMTPITAKKIVILDTCFAGGAYRGTDTNTKAKPNVPYPKLANDFAKDLAKDLNKAGYVVLASADDHESAWQFGDLENYVFTYYVVEGLAGPANADADNDISAEEIYTYAEPRTIDYVAAFSCSPDHPDYPCRLSQHPQMYDGVPGELTVVQW